MAAEGSTKVVLIALACNLGIAIAKFSAAVFTGSSAMLSETIHSLVDASNQGLMLHGIARAARPPDARHPFGYGRELYFWTFVVAIVLFSLGAGVSIYEGIDRLTHPHPIGNPEVNYAVLGPAMLLMGVSTWQALRAFNKVRGAGAPVKLRRSTDPALFTVVIENIAGLAGLTVALVGIAATHLLGLAWADGAASVVIGLILAAIAAFLSVEIKSLLLGEAASEDRRENVRPVFDAGDPNSGPVRADGIQTMQIGHNAAIRSMNAASAVATARVHSPTADSKLEQATSQEAATAGIVADTQAPATKPTIATRPASARKAKGGKRRR